MRLLAGLLLCVASLSHALPISVQLAANPDGEYTTAYKCVASDRADCKTPDVATLTCDDSAALPLTGLLVGTGFSEDFKQFFSGTGKGTTETYGIESVSGDDAATEGWALVTDDLTHDGGETGSGSLRIYATLSGDTVNCSIRQWAYQAPPSGDVTAPPYPLGLEVSTDTNEVSLQWDSVCDNYVGEAGSGTQQYNIRRDSTAVETVAATSCATSQLVQTVIGASDGTPDSVQTGNNWALSFGGAGTGGTTHHLQITGATVSGDAAISTKITALSSAASFAKIGPGFFGSTDADAAFCELHVLPTPLVQMACRASAGASRVNVFTASISSLPAYLKLTRSGNSFSGYYSTDGGTWTLGGTSTATLPTAAFGGVFITSNSAGVNATGTAENVNISSLGRISRDVSTMSGGSWSVSYDDNQDNESAFSAGASGTPASPPAADAIKWHPGHYMLPFVGLSELTSSSDRATRFARYDAVASNTALVGASMYVKWWEIESTQGVYPGIALLEQEIAKLKSLSVPKRFWINMIPQSYGAGAPDDCSTSGSYYPDYIVNLGGCVVTGSTSNQSVAKLWDSQITDRYIAMIEAICAALDSEPYFEGITLWRETSIGPPPSGFSWDAFETQLKRIAVAAKAACPTTNVSASINWFQTQSRTNSIAAYMRSIGVGLAAPDTAPTCINNDCSQGYATVQGIWGHNTVIGNTAGGGVPATGIVPITYRVEASELGIGIVGQPGGYTAQEIFDFYDTAMKGTHLLWNYNDTYGDADQRWATGILPVINANPTFTYDDCPSTYTTGCDTN